MSAAGSERPGWLQRVLPAAVWPYRSFSTAFWEGLRLGLCSFLSYEISCAAEYFLLTHKSYELCVLTDPGVMVIYLFATGGMIGYFFLWRDYKGAKLAHRRIAHAYGVVSAIATSACATFISATTSSLLPDDAWIRRALLVHSVYAMNSAVLWTFLRWYVAFVAKFDLIVLASSGSQA